MKHLLTPLELKGRRIKNRLLLAPSGTATGSPEGLVTGKTLDWFRQRSKGFGITVTEHTAVDTLGQYHPNMLTAASDHCIPGLQRLSSLLRENGCVSLLQLDHDGGWNLEQLRGCLDPLKNPEMTSPADTLSDSALARIAEDFGSAAARVQKAGFDGVQIKGSHVFLIHMLFSPLTNHRSSGPYAGGSFQGRSRLFLEVLQSIRARVSASFLISARIAAEDFCPGGSTVEDAIQLAKLLEQNGADLIDLSGGVKYYYTNPYSNKPGYFGAAAARIRAAVSVPVVLTGGVHTPEQAERLLQEETADIIGVCRAARENEYWAQQALSSHG